MKTFILAAVAAAAIALPSLASAAEQTFYDPAEGEFVTTKVSGTPVIATHDAVKASGATVRFYDPAEGEFVNVPVGN